jgi:hypothetical protein
MLVKTQRPMEATNNPIPTAAKRLGRFMASLDESRYKAPDHSPTLTYPGLDLAKLRREWGPQTAGMPRVQRATFRVPLGINPAQYEKLRNDMAARWLKVMGKNGYDLCPWPGSPKPLRVYPGIYPAIDLNGGVPILDMREFIIEGMFSYRLSKPMRIEIPNEVLAPLVVNA